ncbi:trimethyllysine dioxygenase, mitochondrial [Lucilia cuprina]|uniref:trimethyllysine dioxygenase, mitochondrial n=1 Tax=Lucilia cuprina TaxID=7375 RepID=UPI001F05EAD0|nr:trimethyllysine dioxygenase, mitochondrial [Lucilia cuprina]
MLKIKYNAKDEYLQINQFWLRDHCRCNKCYNETTKQRRYNLLDIPKDVKADDITYLNEGKLLKVTWSDGHVSQYDMDFIYLVQVENNKLSNHFHATKTKWNLPIILQNERHLRFKLTDLVGKESCVKDLVTSLVRYGLVFIDEVPANTTMTEMAIRRVFPVMKTFFGEMYTFSDAPDHADTAYTKEYIGSHTDNTYFCDAAGLQALHCLEHVNGTGGENFFVDGLHCALELKRRNPKAFEMLTKVHVPAEYIEDGQHHTHSAPIIRLDPNTQEIIQLRLNVYDRAVFNTLPQHEMSEFYESFRQFLEIVQSKENQWRLKLEPGTIVIFDNWRVYHGRHAYTGHRTMTGCYVQRTDYMSKARVLGIID